MKKHTAKNGIKCQWKKGEELIILLKKILFLIINKYKFVNYTSFNINFA